MHLMRRSQVALRVVMWPLGICDIRVRYCMSWSGSSEPPTLSWLLWSTILARGGGEISMIVRFSHTYRKWTWSDKRQINSNRKLSLQVMERFKKQCLCSRGNTTVTVWQMQYTKVTEAWRELWLVTQKWNSLARSHTIGLRILFLENR